MDSYPHLDMGPDGSSDPMAAPQGMTPPPSWLITTALCVALSALLFLLLKVTSKCLVPIAAILLTGSILTVLALVTMGVTQVYSMIGTNSTSPVGVFRATCSTMPLVGGELILVITSVCAFGIGIGCMMCIFAGVRRGHHIWAEGGGGLGGVGAMATFCVVGVPFAMIGVAVASAVVVIRCAPPPDNSTSMDNQTWVPLPDWARPPPLLRQGAPWMSQQQSRYSSWNQDDTDRAQRSRARQQMSRGFSSFRLGQQRSVPPPPPSTRMRRPTTTPPPHFESFHHLMHLDDNESGQMQSRLASTLSEMKTKYDHPRGNMKKSRTTKPPLTDSAEHSFEVAPAPPLTTKRVYTRNATMSKVIKIKARNGTFITIT